MKPLIATLVAISLVAPLAAFADTAEVHLYTNISATSNTTVTTSTQQSGRPEPLREVRQLASTTRNVIQKDVDKIKTIASTTREMLRQEADAARTRIQDMASSTRALARAKFNARVEMHVQKITDVLASTTARLSNIADRAQAQIDKLSAAGTNTTNSSALLAAARAKISIANDKAVAADAALSAALSSSSPKSQTDAVRAAVKAAVTSIEDAKRALEDVLKGIRADAKASAGASI